jgi:hypothetical protein
MKEPSKRKERGGTMKKFKILTKPTRLTDLSFDDLYEDDDVDWQIKAERLQARRWRKLKHELA